MAAKEKPAIVEDEPVKIKEQVRVSAKRDADNVARTLMASERTFMAWLRTGVTLIALGLAAAQFLARNLAPGVPLIRVMAVALVGSGLLLMMTGVYRYCVSVSDIRRGVYRPATRSAILATTLMGLVALIALGIILLLRTD